MGLIGWIKTKYRNHKLSQADKLAEQGMVDKAVQTYRRILGKHDLAPVRLAALYASQADGTDGMTAQLKNIMELTPFLNEQNAEAFNELGNLHLDKMEKLAQTRFEEKKYDEAALLLDNVKDVRHDAAFLRKWHRCHAHLLFSKLPLNRISSADISAVISELSGCGPECADDLETFANTLADRKMYVRAIELLTPFQHIDKRISKLTVQYILNVVTGMDAGHTSVKRLSDVCQNKELCKEAAFHLWAFSKSEADRSHFTTAVYYDTLASDFITGDNAFNYDRCQHIMSELSGRAEADEVGKLMELAQRLQLNAQQTDALKDRIASLAEAVPADKAIPICALFLKEKRFDTIYVDQAKKAVGHGSALKADELLGAIRRTTLQEDMPDVLIFFVDQMPSYHDIYYQTVRDKILRYQDVELLDKYWKVHPDSRIFADIISANSPVAKPAMEHFLSRHNLYLDRQTDVDVFVRAVDSLNDDDFAFLTARQLYADIGDPALYYFVAKTSKLAQAKETEEATEIIKKTLQTVDYLHQPNPAWVNLFVQMKALGFPQQATLDTQHDYCWEALNVILGSAVAKEDACRQDRYLRLWEKTVALTIMSVRGMETPDAIMKLSESRRKLSHVAGSASYSQLYGQLTSEITKLRWKWGRELEKEEMLDEAIEQYDEIVDDALPAYKNRAEIRALICAVKKGNLTQKKEERIGEVIQASANAPLREDLTYRYAAFLLKQMRPDEAYDILKAHLPDEAELLSICENVAIQRSENFLADFNDKFRRIEEGTMTVDEAVAFLDRFKYYKDNITARLTDTTNKFVVYKRKLESYVIRRYFDDEQYVKAFKKLTTLFPRFYEDGIRLRNVAIAALGIVESDCQDEQLLKLAVSVWLSAIYHDELFVASLDYTSWDDPYSFTLLDSLGHASAEDFDELPENINFDQPQDDSIISIQAVQNSLVERMESHIRSCRPQLEAFFNEEKATLDSLMDLWLDEKFVVAAPLMASTCPDIMDSLKDAMDYEMENGFCNEEDVLEVGVRYGIREKEYGKFADRMEKAGKCIEAFKSYDADLHRMLSLLPQVRDYDKLYAQVKSAALSAMNKAVREEMPYKAFMDRFEKVCKAFNEEDMSLTFSNYANGKIIHLLNDDQMELNDGVGLMARIYLVAPTNIQVRKNLQGMLSHLAGMVEIDNKETDRKALNNADRLTGHEFAESIAEGRLNGIIGVVNDGKMTHFNALKRVVSLYKKHRNSERICENLCTLCDICIMDEIAGDTFYRMDVKQLLNEVDSSRSATFNRIANYKFRQSYNQVWNSLPFDTQMLLKGYSMGGKILNDKGYALKEALTWLARMGQFEPFS